jgi:molecular chaperone GrpE
MSGQKEKGYSVDIPDEAVTEALESVSGDDLSAEGNGPVTDQPPEATGTVTIAVEAEEAGPDRQALLEALEKAREEVKAAKDRMLRVAADADNLRKRALKERDDAIKFSQEGLFRDLLPVMDNLERTLAHIPKESTDPALKNLTDGLGMVLRQLQDVLAKHNLKGFSAVGEPFDPNRHEALSQMPSADHPPGTVMTMLHRGYFLHERLLRPALVVVAQAPAEPAGPASPDQPKNDQGNTGSSSSEPAQA